MQPAGRGPSIGGAKRRARLITAPIIRNPAARGTDAQPRILSIGGAAQQRLHTASTYSRSTRGCPMTPPPFLHMRAIRLYRHQSRIRHPITHLYPIPRVFSTISKPFGTSIPPVLTSRLNGTTAGRTRMATSLVARAWAWLTRGHVSAARPASYTSHSLGSRAKRLVRHSCHPCGYFKPRVLGEVPSASLGRIIQQRRRNSYQ